jgi:hypothetical protein
VGGDVRGAGELPLQPPRPPYSPPLGCLECSIYYYLLHTPLVNVMSSVDDLRIASVKVDEIQQMIKEQETEYNQNMYKMVTSW